MDQTIAASGDNDYQKYQFVCGLLSLLDANGKSLKYKLVKNGNIEMLNKIKSQLANFHGRGNTYCGRIDSENNSFLHVAALYNQTEIMRDFFSNNDSKITRWFDKNKNGKRVVDIIGEKLTSENKEAITFAECVYNKIEFLYMPHKKLEKQFAAFFIYAVKAGRIDLCHKLIEKHQQFMNDNEESIKITFPGVYLYVVDDVLQSDAFAMAVAQEAYDIVELMLSQTNAFPIASRVQVDGRCVLDFLAKNILNDNDENSRRKKIEFLKTCLDYSIEKNNFAGFATKRDVMELLVNILNIDNAELTELVKKHISFQWVPYSLFAAVKEHYEKNMDPNFNALHNVVEEVLKFASVKCISNPEQQQLFWNQIKSVKLSLINLLPPHKQQKYLKNSSNFNYAGVNQNETTEVDLKVMSGRIGG